MDLIKVIRDLYEEKKRLDLIIGSLEQMQSAEGARSAAPKKRRGRKSMDAKAREEVSNRMKIYWASRRDNQPVSVKQITNGSPNQPF